MHTRANGEEACRLPGSRQKAGITMSAAPTEPVAWRYLVRGIWSVTNIKGAADFWQSEGCVVEPLYTASALAQSNAEPNGLMRARMIALEQRCERGTPWDIACVTIANKIGEQCGCLPIPTPALAQSDAEPVAWRYAYPGYPGHWNVTSDKLTVDERQGNAGCIIEPLYTTTPRPDASAGLLEAAEHCAKQAEYSEHAAQTLNSSHLVSKSKGIAQGYREVEQYLRARAADKSGK